MTTTTASPATAAVQEVAEPLGDEQTARLSLSGNTPSIHLSAAAADGELIRGRFQGALPQVRRAAGHVQVGYRTTYNPARWLGYAVKPVTATFALAAALPWDIDLDGNVHRLQARLAGLEQLEAVRISGSATTLDLALPQPVGTLPIVVGGSATTLRIERPAGIPIRVRVRGAISALQVDGDWLGAHARGLTRETPGWAAATDRIELTVGGSVTQLELSVRAGDPRTATRAIHPLPVATGPTTRKENAMNEFQTRSATSTDGTPIGYLEIGHGPGLVIYHGAMVSARSFTQLAEALAESHTVYIPDRRGRGMSGPFRPDHAMRTEVEDLEAVLADTGAQDVFAISIGAMVALEAARSNTTIRRLAVYEPGLSVDGSFEPSTERLDREVAEGDINAALVTGMLETRMGPPIFTALPRRLLEAMTSMTVKGEDKRAVAGDVTMRQLAPTLRYDLHLIREMSGTLETFRGLGIPVLLLGGNKGPSWSKVSLAALEQTLPNAARIELPGLDHGGACNPSSTNRSSDPALVASELRRFFA